MSYIEHTLLVNEQILYRTRTHKIIFSSTVFWLLLTVVLISLPRFFAFMGVITFIITIYDGILNAMRYWGAEFALTNKRVLAKIGIIRRQSVEIFLQKVEGIQVTQSVLGRIFDYGTIIIVGTGGSRDRFVTIASPLEFRRRVQEQIEIVLAEQGSKNDK